MMDISTPYYEDMSRISNSNIGWFINNGPAYLYRMLHGLEQGATGPQLAKGTMIHEYLLQPDEFYKDYICYKGEKPKSDNVKKVIEEVKKMFRPEFINRVDELLVFKNLEKSELRTIVDLLLEGINKRLADMKIVIRLSPAAKDFIVQEGTDIVYGARPLKRALQKMIEDEIADMILRNEIKNDVTIKVDIQNDKLNFAVEN